MIFLTGVLQRPCFSKVFRRQYCILYFQGVTGVLLCPGFSKSFMGLYCTFMGDRGATASWFL